MKLKAIQRRLGLTTDVRYPDHERLYARRRIVVMIRAVEQVATPGMISQRPATSPPA